MARKRSSSFGADEGLFDNFTPHTHETHEVQEKNIVPHVHMIQEVQEVAPGRELGSTQGKKGQKLRRINMAFSDQNHSYITHESRRRGISATAFVNLIIDEYRKSDDSASG